MGDAITEKGGALLNCFADPKVCLCVCCCPCIVEGNVAKDSDAMGGFLGGCVCGALAEYMPICNALYLCHLYEKVYEGEKPSGMMACCKICCCGPCTLCQMRRYQKNAGKATDGMMGSEAMEVANPEAVEMGKKMPQRDEA